MKAHRYRSLVLIALVVTLAQMSIACANKTIHGAVVADTAIAQALHMAYTTEGQVYRAGTYSQAKHDNYLKVIRELDEDALALTDATIAWQAAGADQKTVPAILARSKAAAQQILDDLANLASDNPFKVALTAVVSLLS